MTQARAGQSRVLVLRGEAGVGKSALLAYLSERASGCRVMRAVGVESEMELAFAGLHQLCAPMLDDLGRLPLPQREALAIALGVSTGVAPDRFLVGLAVLSLMADVAERQPLVCLVDDAQWLDQASAHTLAFVVRRLLAEPVAFVFATRAADDALNGLPELPIRGIGEADAHALLLAELRSPLDGAVRDQFVAECRGNPLALLELPHAWTVAELAGGFGLPDLPLSSRIEQSYIHRLEPLPLQTRQLLLTAAAEPVGDVALLWHALDSLGIPPEAAAAAEAAHLIEFGVRVRFPHPLVRSAIYRSASPQHRQLAHRALAEATDPEIDPDRRAWHRARATSGPDEEVAAELERSAGRAQARGGLAAAAALLQRAAALSPEATSVARRALAAAQAKHQAGATDDAIALLSRAQSGPLDELRRARVDLLRAQLAFGSPHGRDAPPLLLAAAARLEPLDPALARETYLDALSAALFVGRLAGDVGVAEVARVVYTSPSPNTRPPELLMAGLARVITDGYAAGAPLLKQAVTAFRTGDLSPAEALRWLWLATHAAHDVWDDESWEVLCTRHIRLAREVGALAVLPLALSARIGLHLFAGELNMAAALVGEVAAITDATGSRLPPYGALALAAWQGREADAAELLDGIIDDVYSRGEGMGLTLVQHSKAVLYNGIGRHEEALVAAEDGAANPHELAFSTWSLIELIEAAARSGQVERAIDALDRLTQTTRNSGTDWALGIECRSRALVSEGDTADCFYQEAIVRLARTQVRAELARAHLLYGEWLRRADRQLDARSHLHTAHGMFTTMGVEGFAERTRRELLIIGGTPVRKHSVDPRAALTAQESQIARLARDGLSNPDIGAQLFISARTVEWHLRKVFTKLGIKSRRQLYTTLPVSGQATTRP